VVLYVGLIIGSWPNNGFGLNLVGALCIWAVMAGVTQSWVVLVVKAPTAAAAEAPGVDRRNPS
jgi:hypothetical protein